MVDPLQPGTLACASPVFYKTSTKIPFARHATSAPYHLQHHCLVCYTRLFTTYSFFVHFVHITLHTTLAVPFCRIHEVLLRRSPSTSTTVTLHKQTHSLFQNSPRVVKKDMEHAHQQHHGHYWNKTNRDGTNWNGVWIDSGSTTLQGVESMPNVTDDFHMEILCPNIPPDESHQTLQQGRT